MIETTLNYFDIVVVSILLLSCVFAFFRGFVREVLSFGAWVCAGFITIYYFQSTATALEPYFRKPIMAAIVGGISLYVGSLIVFAIFNSYIIKILKSGSSLGVMDNILGLMFGFLRGTFVVSLGYFLLGTAIDEKKQPKWLEEATTRPYAAKGAELLASLAPEYMRDMADAQKRAAAEAKSARENAAENDAYSSESKSVIVNRNETTAQEKVNNVLNSLGRKP